MLKEILKAIDWKKILLAIYEGVKPSIEKKVLETESKWDDAALNAVELLVNKFLRD